MTPKERERRVKAAEVALGELRLSAASEADRIRLDRILRGLRALDDEQAAGKDALDALDGCCAPDAALCDECRKMVLAARGVG